MKKRFLALLLAVLMIGSPVAYADEAAEATQESSEPAPVLAAEVIITEISQPAEAVPQTDESSGAGETAETAAVPVEQKLAEASNDAANAEETAAADTPEAEVVVTAAEADVVEEAVDAVPAEESAEVQKDASAEETSATEDASAAEEIPEASDAEAAPTASVDANKYVRSDEDTQIFEMKLSEPVEKKGTLSNQTISINTIELGAMPTNGYEYLKFTFNGDDGVLYEGYLAGVTVYNADTADHKEDTNTKIVNLVADVADHFYKGESMSLADAQDFADKYGLVVNSIDTEKIHSGDFTSVLDDPDTNLCWAASASNMIQFTNWNDHVVRSESDLENEDEIFDYFEKSYTDEGSYQEAGIKWFMNGINSQEDSKDGDIVYYNYADENGVIKSYCINSDGDVIFSHYTQVADSGDSYKEIYCDKDGSPIFYYLVYKDYSYVKAYCDTNDNVLFLEINGNYYDTNYKLIANPGMEYGIGTGGTQEKTKDVPNKNGNLLPTYAEEGLAEVNFIDEVGYDELYESALSLKDEVATGLAIYFYSPENEYGGGHAVTLFGYIKDTLENGWQSLKALFLTDSDSNKDVTTTRAGAVDHLTMYNTNIIEMKDGNSTIEVMNLTDYINKPGYTTPVLGYSTLKPYSNDIKEETEGTMDAVNSLDYAVQGFEVGDEDFNAATTFTVGDEIHFLTDLANRSYQKVDLTKNPYCVLVYTVKCDEETETLEIRSSLNDGSKTAGNPLSSIWISSEITCEKSGEYTVSVCLKGIYYNDENGNPVKMDEAYTTNNTSKETYSFTVKEKQNPAQGGEDGTNNQGSNTKVSTKTIPVFPEMLSLEDKGNCIIILDGIKDKIVSVLLNGETLTADDYTLTYASDGTPTLTFSEEFIQSLLPGTHTFHLVSESGETLAFVKLTIR